MIYRTILTVVLVSVLLLVPMTPTLADDCTARIDAELRKKEVKQNQTSYAFKVDLVSDARCAKVDFELVVSKTTIDGKDEVVRKPQTMRLTDGVIGTRGVRFSLRNDEQLNSWEFKVTGCRLCN